MSADFEFCISRLEDIEADLQSAIYELQSVEPSRHPDVRDLLDEVKKSIDFPDIKGRKETLEEVANFFKSLIGE